MKKIGLMLMTLILFLSACATAETSQASSPGFDGGTVESYAPMDENLRAPYENEAAIADSALPQQRLVIENADLSLVVLDPTASLSTIAALAEQMGGHVVSSNLYERVISDGRKVPEGSTTIRVPAETLNETLAEIKQGAVSVTSENRSGQDVTQEYTDLSSRLKNLESTERQLTLIMEKAQKTEDVMLVFNQLTSIREQIEVIKGQMKYYEQSAALSAISIQLIAEETLQPIEIGGWKPEGVIRDAVQTLINFLKGFFEFVVWLVIVFIPAGLLIIAVVGTTLLVFWRVARRLWKLLFKNNSPQEPKK